MRKGSRQFFAFWVPWHLLGLLVALLVPAAVRFGSPVLDSSLLTQSAVVGLCYVAVATMLAVVWSRSGTSRFRTTVLVTSLALGGMAAALVLLPYRGYSRSVFVLGAMLSLLLMTVSVILMKHGWRLRAGAAALMLVGLALPMSAKWPDDMSAAHESLVLTHHHPIRVDFHRDVVSPPWVSGGSIRTYRGGLLLVTGDGRFFDVDWPEGEGPALRELPVRVPMNPSEFDAAIPEHVERAYFRVSDVLTEEGPEGTRVYVSHSYWDTEEACTGLRLSETELDRGGEGNGWRTVHDTRPCIPVPDAPRTFIGELAGGRLVRLDERHLLLTVGDHGFDGWRLPENYPQDPEVEYGKTLSIDTETGSAEVFSSGHRNPQGLVIDTAGLIWSTEHGPEGGDELNLLAEGANYGWPFSSLGKEYGGDVWPLNRKREERVGFREPEYAWVPSIAVSNLLAVRGQRFERWRGDLLVSSLRDGDLFRIRTDGGRVLYSERIPVGARIRDLVETEDGRIVLLVDGGTLVSLQPAEGRRDALFARCAGCHGDTDGIGPNLRRVYGREIAALPDYRYSRALSRLDGRWTEERLHAYLADPDSFAPGTSMSFVGIADSVERAAVVDYLKQHR